MGAVPRSPVMDTSDTPRALASRKALACWLMGCLHVVSACRGGSGGGGGGQWGTGEAG